MIREEEDLLTCFPGTPRPQQREFLTAAGAWLAGDKKFLLAEVGTGGGKTHLIQTLLEYSGGYALVPQNTLVDAHVNTFKMRGVPSVKGSSQYRCTDRLNIYPPVSCKQGQELNAVEGAGRCEDCPYHEAKEGVIDGPYGITNYDYFFVQHLFRHEFPYADEGKSILCLDEAQNFEPKLLNFLGISIDTAWCAKYGVVLPDFLISGKDQEIEGQNLEKLQSWLQHPLLSRLTAEKSALETAIEVLGGRLAGKRSGEFEELFKLTQMIDNINRYLENRDEWFSTFTAIIGRGYLKIRPLSVAKYAKDIFDRFDRVAFFSGTILNPDMFAKTLGISSSDYLSVNLPTTFPLDNRRVYQPHPHVFLGTLNMDYKDRAVCLPRVARLALDIANQPEHRGVRGIIHTNSFGVAKSLTTEMIRQDPAIKHRLIGHGSWTEHFQDEEAERNEVKALLRKSLNGILVSPSMAEGLDLPDDDCRFCIIAKAPILPVMGGDAYMAARAAYFDRLTGRPGFWQKWQELGTLIQMCGRGVRSENDWCDTYIVDTRVQDLLSRCDRLGLVPQFFADAVTQFGRGGIPNYLRLREALKAA
jgi:ATP-dependent DNA helicase DinG